MPPGAGSNVGVPNCSLVTDGQLVPPAGAAASQNGAAILGLHPGPESVLLRAAAVVGLKCSLRHMSLPSGTPNLMSGRKNAERHHAVAQIPV
jgi:hypothetical protein